jgi:AmmeMemoRadiSam system protein B
MDEIREPRFAGSFYSENPEILKRTIDSLISSVGAGLKPAPTFGIIVPHAGIQYSGKTAAYGFRVLQESKFDTLILIGPSHRVSFPGVSVDLRKGWRNPLGVVPIDQELGKELKEVSISKGTVRNIQEVFDLEHSLEVEIPFLQRTVPSLRILPLLMGDLKRESCELLVQALTPFQKDRSLCFIASSDFYHGHNSEECKKSDDMLLTFIRQMKTESLAEVLLRSPPPACGAAAIFTLLLLGTALGANEVQVLHQTNSREVTGELSEYIVGYASLALFST